MKHTARIVMNRVIEDWSVVLNKWWVYTCKKEKWQYFILVWLWKIQVPWDSFGLQDEKHLKKS